MAGKWPGEGEDSRALKFPIAPAPLAPQEICIVYEDGAVIVGSVDGNRIWSKDMPAKLSLVEWSPDGRMLVFGTLDGPVLVHNHQGVRIGSITLHAIADLPGGGVPVVAIEWYDGADGYAFPDIPCLAIGFVNGRVQIGRHEEDAHPVLIDSGLQLTHMKWNTSGTALALAGNRSGGGGKEVSEVQFYTPFGRYITCLKVPGGTIGSLTWEGGGMRLAVGWAAGWAWNCNKCRCKVPPLPPVHARKAVKTCFPLLCHLTACRGQLRLLRERAA